MTVGKAFALTAGFVGAVALGVAIGPSITDRMSDKESSVAHAPAVTSEQSAKPAERAGRTRGVRRATPRDATGVSARAADTARAVSPTEPRLQARLKPVLNRGAKLEIAADGFQSGEQFATVAHAARNTGVPFMVLKHHVLNEGRSLADAIHQYKPDIDAKGEVARARQAAKSDLAEIS
jgi:hypothetical protein